MNILFALSWGHKFPKPGLSNEIMAKEIVKLNSKPDLVLAQIEVGEALRALNYQPDFIVGQPGIYLNTYEVTIAMKNFLQTKNIGASNASIAVMCHKAHWIGVKAIFRNLSLQGYRLNVNIPYDPDSFQWYTRGRLRTILGYILHSFGYFFRGELF